MKMEENDLIGKTIKEISVDGFGIEIIFTDGTRFYYAASYCGCSSWDICSDEQE